VTILVKFGWENPPGKQKKTAFWGTEDSPKGLYPWTLGQSQGKKTIEIATNWGKTMKQIPTKRKILEHQRP
jgi:hypothetical protein